jgi:hypothetical protein
MGMREIERIMQDPNSKWAWYELWKAMGLKELPAAALEGMRETSLPEYARRAINGQ